MRGALAGAVAAAAWAAVEPALGRLYGTTYSEVRLLGRLVTTGPAWPAVGLALHVANGAAFGSGFARLGWRGVARGVAAAEAENAALWPALALVQRVHPDVQDGSWPALARSPRIAAYEVTGHGLFGLLLGALVRR